MNGYRTNEDEHHRSASSSNSFGLISNSNSGHDQVSYVSLVKVLE